MSDLWTTNTCDWCGGKTLEIESNPHYEIWNDYNEFNLCSRECNDYFDNWRFNFDLSLGLPFYVTKYQCNYINNYDIIENNVDEICHNCECKDSLILVPLESAFYKGRCDANEFNEDIEDVQYVMFFCKNDFCFNNFMRYFTDSYLQYNNYKFGECANETYNVPYIIKQKPDLIKPAICSDCID